MQIATMYGAGFALQILGLLIMVIAAGVTAYSMRKYANGITYDQLGQFLSDVASTFRYGFIWQGIGFVVTVAGMVLSTVGAIDSLHTRG